MPAAASSRQPGASPRFSGRAAHWLLAEERRWLAAQMASRPARPWLWLVPPGAMPPEGPLPPPRGLLLREQGRRRYAGTVRCGLPLPLPNECLGDVVLQHCGGDDGELLAECARVLVEGGRLWLFTLNRWSPYRLRGPRDLAPAPPGQRERRLRALGLQVDALRYIGPCWRMAPVAEASSPASLLRAACVVVAEKRGLAPVAPAPVAWRRGAAPAA